MEATTMYINFRHRIIALLLLLPLGVMAGQTKLAVYVLAQDAKFIGDYTGGAQVTIKHRDNGIILAQGLTTGGTGNTDKIMNTKPASQKIDKSSAFYLADLSVDVATPVIIEAKGPMAYLHSLQQVSVSSWLYPDQMARPVVIVIPGYIVEGDYRLDSENQLSISAKVRMLCGCKLSPQGHWRSGDVYVWAQLSQGDNTLASVELNYDENSRFVASFDIDNVTFLQKTQLIISARAKDGLHTGRWTQTLTLNKE
jgi:hypothetical protein